MKEMKMEHDSANELSIKKVLDKGYVRLVDVMGSDLSVANAARASFAKESTALSAADARLIDYLARENHMSPFRHAFMTFEIKAPLMVARQHWKYVVGSDHTMDSWNESSRRYITMDPDFYVPGVEDWRMAPEDKKQGSGGPMANQNGPSAVNTFANSQAIANYSSLLERGVAPEQARMVLPQSMMIEATWSGTMGAFAKMCRERLASDAQYETRLVAQQVYDLMHNHMPVSTELLVKGMTE